MKKGYNLCRITDLGRKSMQCEVLSIHGIPWNSKPGSDQATVAAAKPSLCCSIPCSASLSEGDGDSLDNTAFRSIPPLSET